MYIRGCNVTRCCFLLVAVPLYLLLLLLWLVVMILLWELCEFLGPS